LWVERQGNKVKVLTTDGGGEYTANEIAQILSEFQKICADKKNNIEHRMTSPSTAAQNGISERLNRTLITAAKSILHDAALSREFWTLAVRHVVWMKSEPSWHPKLRLPGGVGVSPF
jgi:transposase InsO family protein